MHCKFHQGTGLLFIARMRHYTKSATWSEESPDLFQVPSLWELWWTKGHQNTLLSVQSHFLRQLSHQKCFIFILTHQHYIRLQTECVVNNTLKEEGPLHFYKNTTPHIFILSISMLCILNQLVVQCSLFIQQCTRQPADQQSHHLHHSHTILSVWGLLFFQIYCKEGMYSVSEDK